MTHFSGIEHLNVKFETKMAMSRIQVKYGISAMIKSVWSCQATQELWLVDIVTFPMDILNFISPP